MTTPNQQQQSTRLKRMFLSIILLLCNSLQVAQAQPQLNSFQVVGNAAQVRAVDITTNPQLWQLVLRYGYGGNSRGLSTSMLVMEPANCLVIVENPPITATSNPPVVFQLGNVLDVGLQVDATLLNNFPQLWSATTENDNEMQLRACIRLEFYQGEVLINFANTLLSITAQTNQDNVPFVLPQAVVSEEPDRSTGGLGGNANDNNNNALTASTTVQIVFEIAVFACNVQGDPLEVDPIIPRGQPVRICLQLATPENHPGFGMTQILTANYASEEASLPEVTAITDGACLNNQLCLVDCTTRVGLCRLELLPSADYFINDKLLLIEGSAVVGPIANNNEGRRTRQLSSSSSSSSFQLRHLLRTTTTTTTARRDEEEEEASNTADSDGSTANDDSNQQHFTIPIRLTPDDGNVHDNGNNNDAIAIPNANSTQPRPLHQYLAPVIQNFTWEAHLQDPDANADTNNENPPPQEPQAVVVTTSPRDSFVGGWTPPDSPSSAVSFSGGGLFLVSSLLLLLLLAMEYGL